MLCKKAGINPAFLNKNYTGQVNGLRAADFSRTQAARADIHAGGYTLDKGADTLNIGFPGPLGFQVGMAYIKSTAFTFAADITQIGHQLHLLQYWGWFLELWTAKLF